MRSYIMSFFWILPFLSFLGGYQLLRFFDKKELVVTPKVLGQNINDAIKILSSCKLNVRIMAEKEDTDIPEGTILSQTPQEGQKVKSGQSIFLVITRKPAKPSSLSFYGLSQDEANQLSRNANFNLKSHDIESISPQGTIVAQSILPEQQMIDSSLLVYKSSGVNQLRVFPDLKNRTADEVKLFFEKYNIKVQVSHDPQINDSVDLHNCSDCFVIDQKPLSGTLLDISKISSIQITVSPK